jgi:hypothetical protein
MPSRVLLWRGLEEWLAECATVELDGDVLTATGVQLGEEPRPYRLGYTLATGPRLVTEALSLRAVGTGWHRELDLRRADDGAWTLRADSQGAGDLGEPGGDTAAVHGALDCDIAYSPLTNFMPVRRDDGGPEDYVMAWVSVPDLRLHRSEQRYEPAGERRVRFSDATGFTAELELDDDGFVARYPGLAERV